MEIYLRVADLMRRVINTSIWELCRKKQYLRFWTKQKSLFVRAMRKLGPYFIMNFVKDFLKKDIFKDRYSSICEICYDLSNNKESIEVINDHSEKLESLISTKVKSV